jgi:hypothetical protein
MYILRTIERNGDWVELKRYACIIKACSTAELLSDVTLHRNVIVTDTKTRQSLGFVHGRAQHAR